MQAIPVLALGLIVKSCTMCSRIRAVPMPTSVPCAGEYLRCLCPPHPTQSSPSYPFIFESNPFYDLQFLTSGNGGPVGGPALLDRLSLIVVRASRISELDHCLRRASVRQSHPAILGPARVLNMLHLQVTKFRP